MSSNILHQSSWAQSALGKNIEMHSCLNEAERPFLFVGGSVAMFLFIMFLAFSATSSEPPVNLHKDQKPILTWLFASTPENSPMPSIVSPKHPLFLLYQSGLSGYEQNIFTGSLPHIEMELKSKKLVCFPGSSEAVRRKEFAYLTSQYIQPAPRIVMTKAMAEKVNAKYKKITLKEILNDSSLRGVIDQSRSFGPEIDKLLSENSKNIKKGVFDTFSNTIFVMIQKGRADYTIELPLILNFSKQKHKTDSSLVSLKLMDVEPYITQFLACSKTPEGLQVVKAADELVRKNIQDPKYWEGVLLGMNASERSHFQKEIDKFVKSRTSAAVIIQ